MAWEPAYCSAAELGAYLGIADGDADAELDLAAEAASRAIDHCCNRQFGLVASPEERELVAEWKPRLGAYQVRIPDLMTTTGLVVTAAGATLTAGTGYELLPRDAAARGRPWERLVTLTATAPTLGVGDCTVTVTGRWGWTTVPDTVAKAARLQGARFHTRRVAPFGIAGSPETGSEMRLLAHVDPDVAVMVRSYRRDWPLI
jgi:hypothetical protein